MLDTEKSLEIRDLGHSLGSGSYKLDKLEQAGKPHDDNICIYFVFLPVPLWFMESNDLLTPSKYKWGTLRNAYWKKRIYCLILSF